MNHSTESTNQSVGLSIDAIKNDIEKNRHSLNTFQHEDAINDTTEVREIVPVVTIRDAIFAVKGDISIIGGLPKAGKTSVCAFLLATALQKNSSAKFDSLFLKTTPANGNPVIYIDTEQPQAYTNKLRNQVKKLLGVSQQPENLGIINLRKYDSKTKLEKVMDIMERNPNVHLLIVDGLADLIKDPNDTKESFGVIEAFMMKSDQLNTAIILHIHENPGTSGKLRGNLGSEAERKCGGAISIKKIKEKGIHAIEAKVIRGSKDFETIYFRYDEAVGQMVSLDEAQSAEVKKTTDKHLVKEQKRMELAKKCLITGSLRYGELVERIQQNAMEVEGKAISQRTAEGRVKELVDLKFVSINGDFYAITDKYIPQP